MTSCQSLVSTESLSQISLRSFGIAFAGSCLLALLSGIEVPITPVTFTLQTLGVFLLGLFMSPRLACYSCLMYLAEATMGLPVLSSWHANPFWMVGHCAGYLFAFPVAAYLIAYVRQSLGTPTLFKSLLSVLLGQVVIFSMGVLWLSAFVGFTNAIVWGLTPFIVTDLLKGGVAATLFLSWNRLKA